ncbi:ABC transporter permease [Halogeometricum borinquense]|uniref:ABC transporter permease n=1 Tax=Halogeometricum borinquense TaxID=60847 RepID=A0A482T9B3_9EURY|nr:ABC transporter permease [Halogeometricum borinquense]RYJ08539.1 ABC transporter permease [Halogeometricum borinquense]
MKWYIAKRLAFTLFATWIALTVTFGLITASPNQAQMKSMMSCAATGDNPEECKERFREQHNLDQSATERYKNYMINMATLNWGWSDSRSQYVIPALLDAWKYTAQYAIPVLVISTVIGYALGLYSAYKPYTLSDYAGSFVAFFGISIPNFWFAIILIMLLGVRFESLPVYYQSGIPQQQGWFSIANIKQLLLPITVLLTASFAFQTRYSRAQALEQMNQEFVKVAKAKGASHYRLMVWHVLRMAAVPLSTSFVGRMLGIFFAGSVVIEQIFSIPGLGFMMYTAIVEQDTALVLAMTLITVFLAIIGNLLEDIAYVLLDPRIDYGGR